MSTPRKKRKGPSPKGPFRKADKDGRAAARSVPDRCPDCPGTGVDGHLAHAATCPLGIAAEVRMAADRRWFTDHPGAKRYLRPIQPDEVTELRLVGVVPEGWDAAGDVEPTQVRPGVRVRRFDHCYMFPRGGAA